MTRRAGSATAGSTRTDAADARDCCHCEEHSDEAIPLGWGTSVGDCFASLAMTAKSLKEDSGLFAVAETEARARRAAGGLDRRAAGDAVTLEFLKFGGDVVA